MLRAYKFSIKTSISNTVLWHFQVWKVSIRRNSSNELNDSSPISLMVEISTTVIQSSLYKNSNIGEKLRIKNILSYQITSLTICTKHFFHPTSLLGCAIKIDVLVLFFWNWNRCVHWANINLVDIWFYFSLQK